jgi:hypothetical protein
MHFLAAIHPAPAAPPPGAPLAGWVWLALALGAIVVGGLLIASRR